MSFDTHANLIGDTLAAPLGVGDSELTPTSAWALAAPFNLIVHPAGEEPLGNNYEVVRVTAVGATLTITRAQESTSALAFDTGSVIYLAPTAKVFKDIEDEFDVVRAWASSTFEPKQTDTFVLTCPDDGEQIAFRARKAQDGFYYLEPDQTPVVGGTSSDSIALTCADDGETIQFRARKAQDGIYYLEPVQTPV